ncbi:uncharacterized protein LOC108026026 isoform X2 [Drosophila biarmipes]|uniref:uncharacterized protein LOC108026026 isoform X2 n=1 Tax=Drosophila biarmipes TaxID=125945 RepID=UPI0021CC54DF|nr:uncharacterized protein LOC108026026 isoform X2 [Drosophila biarmipes]
MKYISKRQRKRQKGVQFSSGPSTASSSDENSSQAEQPKTFSRKGKSKRSLKNSTVSGAYKTQEVSPAPGNRRFQNQLGPKKSNSQSSINSLSSGSTMTRYSSTSGSSHSSGVFKEGFLRASRYHFQNAQSITLASFLVPDAIKHYAQRHVRSRTRCSSLTYRVVSAPISPPLDLGEDLDMPKKPWISGQILLTRTSVLCGQMDLGPLMRTDGRAGFPSPPFWSNPYGLTYMDAADSAEFEEDIFISHKLKPIGYEMLMRAKHRAHLERMYNEEVAKLVRLVETTRWLWARNRIGLSLGKTIWSVERSELVPFRFNHRYMNPPKQGATRTHPHANGNPFVMPSAVVCVPGLWFRGQPMQLGYWQGCWQHYWPSYWPQHSRGRPTHNENWWDNATYINAIAQMEMFLVNLSPVEIYAAQMYALHGEPFFDSPMGRCFRGSRQTPPPFAQYRQVPQPYIYPSVYPQPYVYPSVYHQPYVYPSVYHQPFAYPSADPQLAGRPTRVHPKQVRQPMPKPRPGQDGTRPGGSGQKTMNWVPSRRVGKMSAPPTVAPVNMGVVESSLPKNVPSTSGDDLTLNFSNFPPLPAPSKKGRKI